MENQNTVDLTAQQIFDMVLIGIRAQGKPSLDERGDCMYRGLNGCKCAAGMVIPDELYDAGMEYQGFPQLLVLYPKLQYLLPHQRMIDEMQFAHDEYLAGHGINRWETDMHRIAKEFGVQYTRSIPALIDIDPNLPATGPIPAVGAA